MNKTTQVMFSTEAFVFTVKLRISSPDLKTLDHLVQERTEKWRTTPCTPEHRREVLLRSFHLNGHTLGFHEQIKNLEPVVQHNKQNHRYVLLSSFHLNGHPKTETLGSRYRLGGLTAWLKPSASEREVAKTIPHFWYTCK